MSGLGVIESTYGAKLLILDAYFSGKSSHFVMFVYAKTSKISRTLMD